MKKPYAALALTCLGLTTLTACSGFDDPTAKFTGHPEFRAYTYATGDTVQIELEFSEYLDIVPHENDNLHLFVDVGEGREGRADLQEVVDKTLVFAYTVADGDHSMDLDVKVGSSLSGADLYVRAAEYYPVSITFTQPGPLASVREYIINPDLAPTDDNGNPIVPGTSGGTDGTGGSGGSGGTGGTGGTGKQGAVGGGGIVISPAPIGAPDTITPLPTN